MVAIAAVLSGSMLKRWLTEPARLFRFVGSNDIDCGRNRVPRFAWYGHLKFKESWLPLAFAGDDVAGCGRFRRPLRSWRRQHNSSRRLVCSVQLSPRVPVAIRNDAVSRIAAVSAAATRAAGVFIVTRSRCRSPRWLAKLRTARGIIESRRNRHRQRDLGRKHSEGDDQTQ